MGPNWKLKGIEDSKVILIIQLLVLNIVYFRLLTFELSRKTETIDKNFICQIRLLLKAYHFIDSRYNRKKQKWIIDTI